MCGIAGVIGLTGKSVSPQQVRVMADAIRHRGPDDEGFVFVDTATSRLVSACGPDSPADVAAALPDIGTIHEGGGFDIGLAHRRFAIIDLSSGGHQPLCTGDGDCVVTFNGEIYNFVELRIELEALGRRFHTRSDTEVLAEAYRQWGCECFSRFNGFWAVAIYDARARHVVLATDRFGKKPLYWTRCNGRVYFASEIKSLLTVAEVASVRKVNEAAAYRWLAYGLRDVNDETMFAGIHRLPGASWAVVDGRFPENVVRYWEPPAQRLTERQMSTQDAIARTRELLLRAVKLRLRADVPWCVELSGGVDSSVLVALISQIESRSVRTFTVNVPDLEASEARFAGLVADRFGCDHSEIEPTSEHFWADIVDFTYQMEEPYHSPNTHTHQLVWRMMRAHGTKVALNGGGADEAFAGYGHYFAPAIAQCLAGGQCAAVVANVVNWSQTDSTAARTKEVLSALVQLVPGLAVRRLERSVRRSFDWIHADFAPHPVRSRQLNSLLRSELTNTRIPYWLMTDDKSAMHLPFEPRSPFLDYHVVEHACRLPVSYLVRDGWHKWVVRKCVEDVMPPGVLWRRHKMGYPFPERRFFAESRSCTDFILREARNPFINTTPLRSRELRNEDWRVISFLLWHEMLINGNTAFMSGLQGLHRG